MKLRLKSCFESVMSEIGDQNFFIFGIGYAAFVFYNFCREHGYEKRIMAFIVSDISRDKRKVHESFGVPICDLEWIREHKEVTKGFVSLGQKKIENEFSAMTDIFADTDLFYVNELYAGSMFSYYKIRSIISLSRNHIISQSDPDTCIPDYDISDIGSDNIYKYYIKTEQAVCPDQELFGEGLLLDDAYSKQFGDYARLECSQTQTDKLKVCIYTAKSHFDNPVKCDNNNIFEREIQVGAALTDKVITDLKDNKGENISLRNRDYCELTALYWAWKNDNESEYIGLSHYRRRFIIDKRQISFMADNNIQAVYTVPKITDGRVKEEFIGRNYYVYPQVWELTGACIKKICPEYYDAWLQTEKSFFLIACNMTIMHRDRFNDYCSWLFSVLEELDHICQDRSIPRNNRYLGYIGEVLMTVYAVANKDKMKKAFVEYKLLS